MMRRFGFLNEHDIDHSYFDTIRREIELYIYGSELSSVMEPLGRTLWRVCNLAGVKVLEPVIEATPAEDGVCNLVKAAWLLDVSPAKGRELLLAALADDVGSPILRVLLANHLLSRVFWNHYRTPGAPAMLASVQKVLGPIGMRPNPKRIEQAKKGAGAGY